MMMRIRFFLALPAGLLMMLAIGGAIESISHQLLPPTPAMAEATHNWLEGKPNAQAEMATALAEQPLLSLAMMVFAWTVSAGVGAFGAGMIARRHELPLAIALGILATIFAAVTLYILPHPLWMVIAGLTMPLACALTVGIALHRFAPRWAVPARIELSANRHKE